MQMHCRVLFVLPRIYQLLQPLDFSSVCFLNTVCYLRNNEILFYISIRHAKTNVGYATSGEGAITEPFVLSINNTIDIQ